MNGRIVFIDRDISELIPTDDRPLADDLEKIKKLYDERLPIYKSAADIEVSLKGFDRSQADIIRRALT